MKTIKKVSTLFLILLSLFSLFLTTAYASNIEMPEEQILIIMCDIKNDDMSLTEYDTLDVRMYNSTKQKTIPITLYGYNDFADKILVPTGDYTITDVSIRDRRDIVLINNLTTFSVGHGTASVTIPIEHISDVSPIIPTSEPSEDENTSTTIFVNPFETTTSSSDTSSPTVSQTDTTTSVTESNTNNNTTSNTSNTVTLNPSTTTPEDDDSDTSEKADIIILITIVLFLLAIVAIYIIVKKRNKEE